MTKTVHRILVPVDFSPCGDVALTYAAAMGERFHSDVDVLHVQRLLPGGRPRSARELRLRFERSGSGLQMHECLERFENRGVELHGFLSVSPDEATAILEMAADKGYDLIAMGAHGENHWRHIGRVAAAILERAECPVVILHSFVHAPQLATGHDAGARPFDASAWLPPPASASHLPLVSRNAGQRIRHP